MLSLVTGGCGFIGSHIVDRLLAVKSSSGCFSFSMIFSFLDIFHVLQWTFLNSNFFSFPRHISRPKVCISHFP